MYVAVCWNFQLFDVDRAELYLRVLQQLVIMCCSAPQQRNQIQQSYFPKLVHHCLKVLQEPNKQVRSNTLKLQSAGRDCINQFSCLINQH